jgi:hypothetical protein|tara:strand:+ start:1238 stop:1471 length:234 start_codon:yes stop_codon:yes gene_type:complete
LTFGNGSGGSACDAAYGELTKGCCDLCSLLSRSALPQRENSRNACANGLAESLRTASLSFRSLQDAARSYLAVSERA